MLEFFRKYPQLTNSVRGPLLEDKVVDFVLELAKVTDTVVTPRGTDEGTDASSRSEAGAEVCTGQMQPGYSGWPIAGSCQRRRLTYDRLLRSTL